MSYGRRLAFMPLMAMALAATAGSPMPEERLPLPPPPPPRPPVPPREPYLDRAMLDAADEVLGSGRALVVGYTGPIALLDEAGHAHALTNLAAGDEDALLAARLKEMSPLQPRREVGRPARTRGDFPDAPPALVPKTQTTPGKHGRKPRTRRERQQQRLRGLR